MTKELTARDVLIWLSAFFLSVIAVNAYFIYAAVTTFRGEDEQKPYLQGVEFAQTLERRAEQARLGWHATIGASRLPAGNIAVTVVLTGADGSPRSGIALAGELRHPSDETKDRALRLHSIGPGEYRAELPGISAGAWDMVVKAVDPHVPFEASRRIWLP